MSKYINADEFLKKYNEIDLKPYISDKGYAQMIDGYEFWEKWKEEYDRTVRRIVSELLYVQENEDAIIGKIKEIPIAQTLSADEVKVVRCKDCKHRAKGLPLMQICAYFGETDFCSKGERKKTDDSN